jgi:hypothetical protein
MNGTHRAVIGRAADLAHARTVFSALQNTGVDASDIRLAGVAVSDAQHEAQRDAGRQQIDERTLQHVGRRAAGGAVAGALLGGLAGCVVGGVLVAVDAISWLVFAIVVVVPVLLGAVFGAFVSVERTAGYDDTWELTFTDGAHLGAVWVVVRAEDDDAVDRIQRTFTAQGVSASEEQQVEDADAHTAHW